MLKTKVCQNNSFISAIDKSNQGPLLLTDKNEICHYQN